MKTSTAKRMLQDQGRDPELFVSTKAGHGDAPARLSFTPRVPVADLLRAARGPEAEPKRVYIRRNVELERYGYTPGCPGCIAAETDAEPINHSAACRARIEAAVKMDDLPGDRLEADLRPT